MERIIASPSVFLQVNGGSNWEKMVLAELYLVILVIQAGLLCVSSTSFSNTVLVLEILSLSSHIE